MSGSLPSLAELVGSVVQHALRSDLVAGGDAAMLYAVDEVGGRVQGGSQLVRNLDLQQAVIEGKLLLALSATPRTALCYLSVLAGPQGDVVGLHIDARAEGPQVASFGVPLGSDQERPIAGREVWGLNPAARLALGSVPDPEGS